MTTIKIICAWCQTPMGEKPCEPALAGSVSHGICPVCAHIFSGVDQVADRLAHNQKVAGSTPAPATNLSPADLTIESAEFVTDQAEIFLSQHPDVRRAEPITRRQELLARLKFAERQLAEFLR